MKKILISIKPKWCELIANGKKTIEVRKSAPKELPFTALIYETKNKGGCGKVIGEFICDKIYGIYYSIYPHEPLVYEEIGVLNRVDLGKDTCLTEYEINEYLNGKNGYAWHISNLKIYGKPKELSEFRKAGFMTEEKWLYNLYPNTHCHYPAWAKKFEITRPPQSWQYVEVEEW